jgi:hypothetical protein
MRAKPRASRGVTAIESQRLLLSLPGVERGSSYGFPAFKIGGDFLARLRDDDTVLVVQIGSFEDRDYLLAREPDVFFTTDHYRSYPTVLIRLALVRERTLREILEDACGRLVARPKPRPRPRR